mmetsp:Transcript_11728/g.27410  ORF Transcript_11728/g.27410 Transcript_11728/m.27410 type:complete len:212 (-) Transcript_11728:139-774(-)
MATSCSTSAHPLGGTLAASAIFERYEIAGCCPREFDPARGVYRVSADGLYLLRISVVVERTGPGAAPAALEAQLPFVVLRITHPSGDAHVEHVLATAGSLFHLRAGALVAVHLVSPVGDGGSEIRGARWSPRVQLSVELSMRKRKRARDLEEDEETRRALPAAREAEGGDGTGSDTEWSDGFSSDDEQRRSAREAPKLRRMARELDGVSLA